MSFQITVLKVLAGHPEGHASLVDLKHYVAVLSCSGADWSQRMKRLAARAPDLDIFSSGYVLREAAGWHITDAGRAFLKMIEAPATEPDLVEPEMQQPVAVRAQAVQPEQGTLSDVAPNVIRIAEHRARRRRAA
ncbi:MAG: hypothetical protein J0H42_25650 [Rhizobiales bacterium]|nr:hypothetical protein [Hyphomicrobiales bacterium]